MQFGILGLLVAAPAVVPPLGLKNIPTFSGSCLRKGKSKLA